MGATCSSINKSEPSKKSLCDNGQVSEWANFCTMAGPSGDSKRKNFCNSIGDGEWEYSGQGSSCYYNDCKDTQESIFGCCNGCCGILGAGVKCKRKEYKADPLKCCLDDMKCNAPANENNPDVCFQDSSHQRTCSPQTRNMTTTTCRDRLMSFCSGEDLGPANAQELIARWVGTVNYLGGKYTNICQVAVQRNLYSGTVNECTVTSGPFINNDGYEWAQDVIYKMSASYSRLGGSFSGLESSESNTSLNDMYLNLCSAQPGICKKSLFANCATVTNADLTRNPNLLKLCGCYMPDEQYSKYTNLYQIPRECTPVCGMAQTIKLPNPEGNGPKLCNTSTCVISDTSIEIAGSMVGATGEGIQFSQICGNCSTQSLGACNCTVAGNTLKIIDSYAPTININQYCGTNSVCYYESGDKTQKQPCSGDNTSGYDNEGNSLNPFAEIEKQNQENKSKVSLYTSLIIAAIFIVIIVIIIVVWSVYYPPTFNYEQPAKSIAVSTKTSTSTTKTPSTKTSTSATKTSSAKTNTSTAKNT